VKGLSITEAVIIFFVQLIRLNFTQYYPRIWCN